MTDREPVEAPPWRPEHGPRPRLRMWPPGHRPALRIRIGGQWQYCVVHMRLDYADGTVGYQVDVRQPDGTVIRTYRWDPEVMRIAHGSDVDPDDHRDPEDGRS